MPLAFGARTERHNNYVGVPKDAGGATQGMEHLGPGSHLHDAVTTSFSRVRPSFAAFGATAERSFRGFGGGGAGGGGGGDEVPGPGMYLSDASGGGRASQSEAGIGVGVFRSSTSRASGPSTEAGATSPRRQPAHYEKTPGPGAWTAARRRRRRRRALPGIRRR